MPEWMDTYAGQRRDWVCDRCGRKRFQKKVPARCHAWPMRPMGGEFFDAADLAYAALAGKSGELPDDFWVTSPGRRWVAYSERRKAARTG